MFTLPTFILILNICIFGVGILLLTTILPYRKRLEIRWLIVLTIAFSVISFSCLNVYIQESLQDKIFFSRLRFLGLGIVAQSWFFFLVLIYSRNQFLRHPLVASIAIAPSLVTMAASFVPALNSWLATNYEIFRWQGATLVSYTGGFWFPIHIVLANLFAFSGMVFLLFKIPRSSGAQRKQMIVLLIGSTVSLFIDTYGVVANSPIRWAMLSGGLFLVTEAAIYFAIQKQGLLDLSPIAKNLIFKEIPDPVIILDDHNRILDFNEAASIRFQVSEKLLSSPWKELTLLRTVPLEQHISEWSQECSSGEPRTYQVHITTLDSEKTSAGKIVFFRDVSNLKRIEQRLNGDLEFKAQLLSLIAHDFSSILQTQSLLSSHLTESVQPELKDTAQALTSSNLASQDLMTNILTWTKAQQKQMSLVLRPFEINTLIQEVVNGLEGALNIKNLKIDFTSKNYPFVMEGDSVMIESVLRNILTNAIRASFPGQKICVSFTIQIDEIQIFIQDFGIGMNIQELDTVRNLDGSLFIDSEKPPQGFGIGLTIAKKFVDIHQGHLDFEAAENKGTLVTLRLPLKKPSC